MGLVRCLPLATEQELRRASYLGGTPDSFSSTRNPSTKESIAHGNRERHRRRPSRTGTRCGSSGMRISATVLASTSDFSAAYRDDSPLAFSAAYRVLRDASTAEDVVQDAFTTLWRHPDKFDPQRGSLPGYVAMMAASRAVDRMRSRKPGSAAADRLAVLDAQREQAVESPQDAVMRRHEAGRVLAAVAEVSGRAARRGFAGLRSRPVDRGGSGGRGGAARHGEKPAAPGAPAHAPGPLDRGSRGVELHGRGLRPDRDRLRAANRDRSLSPTPLTPHRHNPSASRVP